MRSSPASLKRHAQTWNGIVEGAGYASADCLQWPGLNEYDAEAVIRAVHPGPLERPDTPELYREHFRLLRRGLSAVDGGRDPARRHAELRRLLARREPARSTMCANTIRAKTC